MKPIIKKALQYYIEKLECDITSLKKYSMDVGFLPQYLEEAKAALAEIESEC